MIRAISKYLNGRLFEWFAALNLAGIGTIIVLWPETLAWSAFKYLVTVGTAPMVIGVGSFVLGYARIVALVVNGRSWVYGPRVRAWCSLLSAVIWLQILISLAQFAVSDTGVPSLGLSNWAWLFFGELIVAYRAATDVRTD